MIRLDSGLVGIDQGSKNLFSDYEDDGEMWAGTGPREVRAKVTFSRAFKAVPAVMVGLSMWDLDQKTNARSDISADNITNDGFDIVFKTWGDTRVARVRATWQAIGELPHPDDWDLY